MVIKLNWFFVLLTTPLLTSEGQFDSEVQKENLMHQHHILSVEQLYAIQTEIFDLLKAKESSLTAIQGTSLPLMEKWQGFLQLILPIQLEALKNQGLETNQLELSRFNEQYMRLSAEYPTLFELNKQKWLFLFEKAFGVTEFKEISLEKAQSLMADIVDEMTSETFLEQVDSVINDLEAEATLIQKRTALLSVLFPLHMLVMAKHGFEGETGYIQAQRAMMDYYFDPKISQSATSAQSIVFKRAQLID